MNCPIANYVETGKVVVKLAAANALFVLIYAVTFSLTLLHALAGPAITVANRFLAYFSQLLSFPIGCVLAGLVLLRIGTLNVKVIPSGSSFLSSIASSFSYFRTSAWPGSMLRRSASSTSTRTP